MKFGILASHQYLPEDDLRQRLYELWDLTELAAEQGFDSIFAINHFLANLQTPQTISVVAKLIQHSGNMTVGTSLVILPAYHAVHIAEEFATLDHMAGGRLVLGVGAGYRNNEFAAMNIDKPNRFRKMHEQIRLIRALWTGERVDFDGEFYSVHDSICVKPFQQGGPPIWVGAGGPISVRKAAELGDAWIIPGNSPKPGWHVKAMANHDDALAKAGKSREGREYPMIVNVFCAPTTQLARDTVRSNVEREYFNYAEYPQLAFQKEKFEYMWENLFMVGDPDFVAERIARLEETGVNHIIARPYWLGTSHERTVESVKLFAKEVMPRFAGLASV
ncbi:LLM class flavin-dependent oxidoreductase [Streptosporangium sp. NPDC001681]|uniref:LLM class flavin-dependent oxidoreductase n=1 Tax=unclassified Streptosporangium TaxID=2632669 RepID=UPI0033221758